MLVLKGIPASPGIAIGKAVLLPGQTLTVSKHYIALEAVEGELRKWERALQKTVQELEESAVKGACGIIVNFMRPRYGAGILVEFVERTSAESV